MYALVRVRGVPDRSSSTESTLDELGLNQRYDVSFVPETDSFRGMVEKVKDIITFGKVDPEFVAEFLEQKDVEFSPGNGDSMEEALEELDSGDVSLSELRDDGFVNVLNTGSPRKGFRDTKRHYLQGGSLGDRGEDITNLLKSM